MRLKILPLLVFSLFYFTCSNAQTLKVLLLKNNGKTVSTRDSADFIRVVSEPDSGSTLYNVKEYFATGKAKLVGKTSKIEHIVLEGACVTFFPSGKRKTYVNYKDGNLIGDAFEYFPNGKLYAAKKYAETAPDHLDNDYLIETCNDSTGKALVTDGNGYYIGYDDDFKRVYEEGSIKSGLRDGNWKGREENKYDTITFVEQYDKGKMISGSATDKNKQVYQYAQRQVEPQFKGGLEALYRSLGNKISYPSDSRNKGIQGLVMLKFVVEKDGSIASIEVLQAPAADLANEAVRVLKKTPKWIPGMMYGRDVRVSFTLPVNFNLD